MARMVGASLARQGPGPQNVQSAAAHSTSWTFRKCFLDHVGSILMDLVNTLFCLSDRLLSRFENDYATWLNVTWATPFAFRFPDNRTLIIRDHVYPLDDVYCFLNGWYKYTTEGRTELLNNWTYLEEVSDAWCHHLEKTMPGYYNISMVDLLKESKDDENFLEALMKNGSDSGYVPQSVVDGMYLHAASKCVMRGQGCSSNCYKLLPFLL